MYVATLVRADGLTAGDIAAASDALVQAGCVPGAVQWIEPGAAADLPFTGGDLRMVRSVLEAALPTVDVIAQVAADRRRKLIIADMDSTMITVECIDELADYAGIKAQVAEVTEAAMRGELDFEAALDARVALLGGLDSSVIARCLAERVHLMPGARALVRTMRADGASAILVSGGFTDFADPVAAQIGFERAVANRLAMAGGRLTGTVVKPIVDSATKREQLLTEVARIGCALSGALAVGDGANDIPMIEAAGLGVAYHAKPKTAAAADAAIRHGDLTVLLYAQGYARRDWVS